MSYWHLSTVAITFAKVVAKTLAQSLPNHCSIIAQSSQGTPSCQASQCGALADIYLARIHICVACPIRSAGRGGFAPRLTFADVWRIGARPSPHQRAIGWCRRVRPSERATARASWCADTTALATRGTSVAPQAARPLHTANNEK